MEPKTTILAIETTTELASIALLCGDKLLQRELDGVVSHSQGVLPAVQSLLQEAGLALGDCSAIAFGCGPGAFTGIRTTCGIVQGLAIGSGLPVIPVVSLHAMALAAHQQTGADDLLCVLDARMQEVYWARYRYLAGQWQIAVAPELSVPALVGAEFGAEAQAGMPQMIVCGNGVTLEWPAEVARCSVMPHAAQVAQLGAQAFAAGLAGPPESAQPLYLRNKIALTTAERLQARAAQRS